VVNCHGRLADAVALHECPNDAVRNDGPVSETDMPRLP